MLQVLVHIGKYRNKQRSEIQHEALKSPVKSKKYCKSRVKVKIKALTAVTD